MCLVNSSGKFLVFASVVLRESLDCLRFDPGSASFFMGISQTFWFKIGYGCSNTM